jgi:hypothetical protein
MPAKKETIMEPEKHEKCAHIPCLCMVSPGEKYCGDVCREAGKENVEIACQCGHPECPLTV